MSQRIDYRSVAPHVYEAMAHLGTSSSIDMQLIELVNIRASQINGCAFCLSVHIPGGRQTGLTDQQVDLLSVWREAGDIFSARERAALAWAESLTLLPQSQAPDELYEEVRVHFSEQETVELTWAIVTINVWNRMAVSMRVPPRRVH
ncbi:MAG: 4-carboxymuconolactone decarboxylase domain/alkylhydroperoxidase AhpD family core domain protein [uncultured Chloroflexia bacterium]|uniref:4-carboxymuconolactone decarboxylase domain/alkylhydroperoxidase AhpD family core domain protein n=1 Tax=uncultured Chloroflexia bacterium TaxID=1672391 RepID=A0A6J4LP17_9CHLR|nr:MAG: 4-carboxymuconolactone decarboxylase domain/alkylhydroperoxidase AhpD family core domain protein [uncultured Chloroflexia bacterium]